MSSREAMLTAIRRGLKRGVLPEDQQAMLRGRLAAHGRHLIPARSRLPHPGQVALFVANVEKEFGTVAFVPNLAAVPGALADYLAAQNLPTDFVMAPHPDLRAIPWSDRPMLNWRVGRAEASDMVSVQHGFAAVAETGTLMLPSAPERPGSGLHSGRRRARSEFRVVAWLFWTVVDEPRETRPARSPESANRVASAALAHQNRRARGSPVEGWPCCRAGQQPRAGRCGPGGQRRRASLGPKETYASPS